MCSLIDVANVPAKAEMEFNNFYIGLRNKKGCEGYAWRAFSEVLFIAEFVLNLILLPLTLPFYVVALVLAFLYRMGVPGCWEAQRICSQPFNVCTAALFKLGEAIALNLFVSRMEEVTWEKPALNYDCCGAAQVITVGYEAMCVGENGMTGALVEARNNSTGMLIAAELIFLLLFLVHIVLAVVTLPFHLIFMSQFETEWGKVFTLPLVYCLDRIKIFAYLLVKNLKPDTIF